MAGLTGGRPRGYGPSMCDMRTRLRLVALAAWVALAAELGGQAPAAAPERATVLKAARELMVKARYCGLVTLDATGQPQARVVDAFEPEADFTVWIATNPATRKVSEIRADGRVTLLYVTGAEGYVTLIGKAALVSDAAEKARRWKDDWLAFYKDKNRGDDYQLIRVTPSRLEVVSYAHGVLNDPTTWKPVSVELP